MSMFSGSNQQGQQQQQQPQGQNQTPVNSQNNVNQGTNTQQQQPQGQGDQNPNNNNQQQQQQPQGTQQQQQQSQNQPVTTFAGVDANRQQQASQFAGVDGTQQSQTQAPNPVDPNTYTAFTLPAHIDQSDGEVQQVMNIFRAEAGKRGMTQEHAQATLDLMQSLDAQSQSLTQSRVAEQSEAWQQESAQKGLLTQDSAMAASAGLMALDPKGELRQTLSELGMSYHPALIQAFAAFHVGRNKPAMLTGGLNPQPTDSGQVDLGTALYGTGQGR